MTPGGPQPTPRALDAVRDLERALDVRKLTGMLAEQQLRDARLKADELLAAARTRGEQAAQRTRQEALAAAESDVDAILAAADAEVSALQRSAGIAHPGLLTKLRVAVLPVDRSPVEH